MSLICSEYFLTNDSKKSNDTQTASGQSNADLITNHLNETTAKTATGGTSQ